MATGVTARGVFGTQQQQAVKMRVSFAHGYNKGKVEFELKTSMLLALARGTQESHQLTSQFLLKSAFI